MNLKSIDLSPEQILAYRKSTYQGQGVATLEEAIAFVNQRGFVYFWPIEGVELPSLWVAVAGARPVPNAHDDPGHITWRWKDEMLDQKKWYYAKLLRKRATIISMELVPYFYALSENYGSPEEDYLIQYEQGRMKQETKDVYELILAKGPLDTVEMRRKLAMTSKRSDYRFNRALVELQMDFKIMPVAVTESGAWRYAFAYDLVSRHLPELPERARFIQETDARLEILHHYFRSVGASTLSQILKVFGWRRSNLEKSLSMLVSNHHLRENISLAGSQENWFVLQSLLDLD
jgi:hypothetical protein